MIIQAASQMVKALLQGASACRIRALDRYVESIRFGALIKPRSSGWGCPDQPPPPSCVGHPSPLAAP